MSERDLPEGVINANPPGGWEGDDVIDGETAESSEQAPGADEIVSTPDGLDVGPVEGSVQGADPDLSGDLGQGRPADPDVDAAENVRQGGV